MQTQRQISVRKAAQAGQATVVQSAILEAAETLFAKRGLQGTRVRDIADMAGVNVATLYNYYTNKDALYEAVLDRGIQPLIDIMKQFSAEASQGVEATELIDAIMAHLQSYPQISRLIYLEAISEGEYLQKLSSQWLRPLLTLQQDMLTAMGLDSHSGQDSESIHPLLSSLFIQLSFGHFAIAPLLKEVYGQDPTSHKGIEQQKRLIAFLAAQLFQFPLYQPATSDNHLVQQDQSR